MMAAIKDCLELTPEHYGEPVDLAQLPRDYEVYRIFQQADTVGMFQVESRAQMTSLPRNYPEKFYNLVGQVAIIRSGPIIGKMMHSSIRRQKREEVTYSHPSLISVLKRALGLEEVFGKRVAHISFGDNSSSTVKRIFEDTIVTEPR